MDYKNTFLPSLREDCINEFGQEKGMQIYSRACDMFTSMLAKADFRGSKIIEIHVVKNILPITAYYLTLQAFGYSKEEAYNLTLKETQKTALIQKRKNESLSRLPFMFQIFKLFAKGIVKKVYPAEGWETEWVKIDNEEIHLNFKSCIYLELTTEHGCPELCSVFCENDVVTFAGYEPKIHFTRSGTLAKGNSCCDFHFTRGKGKK